MTADGLPYLDAETVAEAVEAADGIGAADTPGAAGDDAPTVAGVLLAAGTSSRFGEANKLLADLDGEPLVRHAARTLLDADLSGVVAVLGYEAEAVREALDDLDVRTVRNPDFEEGLSTTVAWGVRAVEGADAAVFLPADLPAVDPSTVDRLVDAYRADLGTALAAAHDGCRGNPVLFDRRHFDDLRDLAGDVGGRPVLLGSDGGALVATGDPGVTRDVDTVADLRRRR